MNFASFRRLIGIIILLVSLVLLIWGLWPYADQVRTLLFEPEDMLLPAIDSLIWDGFIL